MRSLAALKRTLGLPRHDTTAAVPEWDPYAGLNELQKLALDPRTPEWLLRQLALHPRYEVRCRTAANPSCPDDTLQHLANDPEVEVRWGVAVNPSAPTSVLDIISTDPEIEVRKDVARHPNASAAAKALAALTGTQEVAPSKFGPRIGDERDFSPKKAAWR